MRRLDSAALYAALDRQRATCGLTWADLARETGVSVATIRRTEQGGRMEVDGCSRSSGGWAFPSRPLCAKSAR